MTESRCDQYRDLLDEWARWWHAHSRDFTGTAMPPVEQSRMVMVCLACAGPTMEPGERCAACGRLER